MPTCYEDPLSAAIQPVLKLLNRAIIQPTWAPLIEEIFIPGNTEGSKKKLIYVQLLFKDWEIVKLYGKTSIKKQSVYILGT